MNDGTIKYPMAIQSITDALRDAINDSAIPSKTLARETGIPHPSIIRFRRGDQTIHLDAADKIAAYFGLELKLAATQPEKANPANHKKKGK